MKKLGRQVHNITGIWTRLGGCFLYGTCQSRHWKADWIQSRMDLRSLLLLFLTYIVGKMTIYFPRWVRQMISYDYVINI